MIFVNKITGIEVEAEKTDRMGDREGYDVIGPGGSRVWWTKELFEKTYRPQK